MHYLFQILKSFINRISEFILLFSQILSIQIAFYPIIFIGFIMNFQRFIRSKLTIVSIMFIFTIGVSIYLRGGSIEFILKLIQYYLGILLVTIYFKINKNISIGPLLIYSFVGLVFYEVISTNIFGVLPFFYNDPDLALTLEQYNRSISIHSISLSRAQTLSGFYRAYGPPLNASVSGSMLVVLFFILFDKRKSGVPMHLIVLVFAAFVFSGSNTAVALFFIMWALYLFNKINKYKILTVSIFLVKLVGKGLIVLTLGYLLYSFLQLYFDLSSTIIKFNTESISFVINQKINGLNQIVEEAENILFGRDLSITNMKRKLNYNSIGGDSQIFNLVQNLGMYGLLGLLSILLWISEKGTRIYIIGGFIASIHYGVLFTLSGQFFFAAVASNAILRKPAIRQPFES